MRWCFAERNRSAGRSGHAQKTQRRTHTRAHSGAGAGRRRRRARFNALDETRRRSVVLVVTPSISAANFVHVRPAEEDVHDNDDNYTQNYTHTRPTTACTGLSKTIIILMYKYMRHDVVLPRRKSMGLRLAGENNPPGPERDRNIKTPKTHGRRIDFNRNDA